MKISKILKNLNSGKVLLVSKNVTCGGIYTQSYPDSVYRISNGYLEHIYAGRFSKVPQAMSVLIHICKRKGWYRDAILKFI